MVGAAGISVIEVYFVSPQQVPGAPAANRPAMTNGARELLGRWVESYRKGWRARRQADQPRLYGPH